MCYQSKQNQIINIKNKVMKKQTVIKFASFNRFQSENLPKTVNENLALEFAGTKSFSTADLWNIQRRGRTMLDRRNHF